MRRAAWRSCVSGRCGGVLESSSQPHTPKGTAPLLHDPDPRKARATFHGACPRPPPYGNAGCLVHRRHGSRTAAIGDRPGGRPQPDDLTAAHRSRVPFTGCRSPAASGPRPRVPRPCGTDRGAAVRLPGRLLARTRSTRPSGTRRTAGRRHDPRPVAGHRPAPVPLLAHGGSAGAVAAAATGPPTPAVTCRMPPHRSARTAAPAAEGARGSGGSFRGVRRLNE